MVDVGNNGNVADRLHVVWESCCLYVADFQHFGYGKQTVQKYGFFPGFGSVIDKVLTKLF